MVRGIDGSISRHLRGLFGPGTAVGLGEAQLVGRFVEGNDASAFEAIVERHGPMVWGVCRRWLRDPNDAEDAFQATFLILARRAGSIGHRERLGGWLHGVACRVASRSRREAARRPTAELDGLAAKECGDGLQESERAELLHQEIERLPARYRDPIVLCHLEGCTHDEAAARLGWPLGTVRGRLSRGRDRLRDRLTARGMASATFPAISHARRSLTEATARAATAFAAGRGATSVVSARATILIEGVLNAMIMTKIRSTALAALAAGLIITTGTVVLSQSQKAGQADPQAATRPPGSGTSIVDGKRTYVDGKYGFSMAVPEPWAKAPLGLYTVPGQLRAAWSGPSAASITAFVQESGTPVGARFILEQSVRVSKKGKHRVTIEEIRTVDAKQAMWMVETGMGTGGTLGAGGSVETTAHWVAIPREEDVVVVLMTCPAVDYDSRLPSFLAAINSLRIEGKQSPEAAGPSKPARAPTVEDLNLGFEQAGEKPTKPKAWFVSGNGFVADAPGYEVELDDAVAKSGLRSLRMKGTGRGQFGNAFVSIPGEVAAGKNVKVSGWIKTKDVAASGYAGIWCRVDGPEGLLAHDNMAGRVDAAGKVTPDDRGVRGSTDWKSYSVGHDVPAEATGIVFGALLTADGTAWWDDFAVEIDGKPYEGRSPAGPKLPASKPE